MKLFIRQLRPAALMLLAMTLICGVIYTAALTGIGQLFFHKQANGSIICSYGSELLGQEFTDPQYLIGRPTGVSSLSPTSDEQALLVKQRQAFIAELDPTKQAAIPAELVMASGSGADPNISPAAAEYQADRIARERGMSAGEVRAIIAKYTTGRFLGFIGEPVVNVLKVNLALDGKI